MSRRRTKKSERLVKFYRSVRYWANGLREAPRCHRFHKLGFGWNDHEKERLFAAQSHLNEAEKIFDILMKARIGEAVVQENTYS